MSQNMKHYFFVKYDSKVMSGQVEKDYEAREAEMVKYLGSGTGNGKIFQRIHNHVHTKR
jgi:hypothetical protein